MRSPFCDDCHMGKAFVYCMAHSARLCLQCDFKLHSSDVSMDNHVPSRFMLCQNCVSEIVCDDQGLCLCRTCVSNPNVLSRFLLSNNSSNNTLSYTSPLDFDFDSSSSSCSSSYLIDIKKRHSFVSLPFNNVDSFSSSGFFHNYTKSYTDVPMSLQPDFLDIPKDSSCYDTKEDIDNAWLNSFDGDLKEYFPGEDLILTDQLNLDELKNHNADTTIEMPDELREKSTVERIISPKDYNIDALANSSCQDYIKNQMICSNQAKEETNFNSHGIFPNHIDLGPSQLILTDEILTWDDPTLGSNHVYSPRSREEAVKRYFEKKKKRKYGRQIRYQSRKSTADTKRRWKGRFTKAGAEYDYDPRADDNNKETIE